MLERNTWILAFVLIPASFLLVMAKGTCWPTCLACIGPSSNQCLSCNSPKVLYEGQCISKNSQSLFNSKSN